MIDQMYSTEAVAEILCTSVRNVQKLRSKGKLQPVKVGRLNRYPENQIRQYMRLDADADGITGAPQLK